MWEVIDRIALALLMTSSLLGLVVYVVWIALIEADRCGVLA